MKARLKDITNYSNEEFATANSTAPDCLTYIDAED